MGGGIKGGLGGLGDLGEFFPQEHKPRQGIFGEFLLGFQVPGPAKSDPVRNHTPKWLFIEIRALWTPFVTILCFCLRPETPFTKPTFTLSLSSSDESNSQEGTGARAGMLLCDTVTFSEWRGVPCKAFSHNGTALSKMLYAVMSVHPCMLSREDIHRCCGNTLMCFGYNAMAIFCA